MSPRAGLVLVLLLGAAALAAAVVACALARVLSDPLIGCMAVLSVLALGASCVAEMHR